MKIIDDLLSYCDRLEPRETASITLVVIHCTELPDLAMARQYGEKIQHEEHRTGNSGHYYVDRDGTVYRYVPDDRVAHHVIGHNRHSIGIEVVNSGRYPQWFHSKHQNCSESYPLVQVQSVKDLLRDLRLRLPELSDIARHSDLDTTHIPAEDDPVVSIRRKIDPGPLFPWPDVLSYFRSL